MLVFITYSLSQLHYVMWQVGGSTLFQFIRGGHTVYMLGTCIHVYPKQALIDAHNLWETCGHHNLQSFKASLECQTQSTSLFMNAVSPIQT